MSDEARLFTFFDMNNDLCTFDEVGTPFIERSQQQPDTTPAWQDDEPAHHQPLPDMSNMTDAEIAQTSVRLLREATIEVFHRVGAADWLYELARTDPKNFLKMLQRLLPQSIEATVNVTSFEVPAHIRSLSLEDLKAMRSSPSLAATAGAPIDVEFIEVARGNAA